MRTRGRGHRRAADRDRVCGIDIGKAQMVATIRVPSERDPARRAQETRSSGAARSRLCGTWARIWQQLIARYRRAREPSRSRLQ